MNNRLPKIIIIFMMFFLVFILISSPAQSFPEKSKDVSLDRDRKNILEGGASEMPRDFNFAVERATVQHQVDFPSGDEKNVKKHHPWFSFKGSFDQGTLSKYNARPVVKKVKVHFWQVKTSDKSTMGEESGDGLNPTHKDLWEIKYDSVPEKVEQKPMEEIFVKYEIQAAQEYDDIKGEYYFVEFSGEFLKECEEYSELVDRDKFKGMIEDGWKWYMRIVVFGDIVDIDTGEPKEGMDDMVLYATDLPYNALETLGKDLDSSAFSDQVGPIVVNITDLSLSLIAVSMGVLLFRKMTAQLDPSQEKELKQHFRHLGIGSAILLTGRVISSFVFWILTGDVPDSVIVSQAILNDMNGVKQLMISLKWVVLHG